MARKSGKDPGDRRAKAPADGNSKKKAAKKSPSKKSTRKSVRQKVAREPAPDTTPVDVGHGGLLVAIMESEHPDLMKELRAEAQEEGTSLEATVITALRDAYGLPERFEPTYVVHVCPECAARHKVEEAHAHEDEEEDEAEESA